MPQHFLKVENLIKSYGPLKAVDGVSFAIEEGEIFGLLGPNGAGKTTIISSIMTLEKPDQGDISICGFDIKTHPKEAKSLAGFMPQELALHGYFNLEEVVSFYSGFCGVHPDKERLRLLFKKLELLDWRKHKVRVLSGGMKRRLMMAKALIHSPKLLLLDEPTAGVDLSLRETMWNFIRDLKKSGAAVLFTTHYLEEAEKLCDRVAFIHKGKIRCMGETKKLISNLTTRQVHVKFHQESAANLKNHKDYRGKTDEGYDIFMLPYSSSLSELFQNLGFSMTNIADVKIKEGSLEDVFQFALRKD